MDYMEPAVCCPQKAVILNHSLTHSLEDYDEIDSISYLLGPLYLTEIYQQDALNIEMQLLVYPHRIIGHNNSSMPILQWMKLMHA